MYVIIVPSTLSTGVVESQVLGMVRGLYSKANPAVLFLGSGANERKEVFSQIYPEIKFLTNTYSLLRNRKKIKGIYCRSVFNYLNLYILRLLIFQNVELHYDFRALISEESYLKNNRKLRFYFLRMLELFTLKTANKVFTVSNNLKTFLLSNLGYKREIIVTPCCIEHSEIRLKEDYVSTGSSIKMIYVGSMSKWQGFNKVCSIFKKIQELLPCHLTVVTTDKEIASSILNEFNITDYKVKSGNREQVLEILADADFGFVFREENIVNKTASPIKFLEYTSQGVIPLMTNSVGDYSALTSNINISISLEDESTSIAKNISLKLQNKDILRKLYEFSLDFTWEKYADKRDS